MSARMLQRVLRKNQAEASSAASSDVQGSDSEGEENRGLVSNPFDLLGFQDEDDSEDGLQSGPGSASSSSNPFDLLQDKDEREDGDAEREPDQQSGAGSASTSAAVPVSPFKLKNKKNKSKKKGKKESGLSERPNEELLDKHLERLQVGNGEGSSSATTSAQRSEDAKSRVGNIRESANLLGVDVKNLKAEDELRRIFGSKVINSAERKGEGVSSMRRQQRGAGRRTSRSVPLRKSVLVVPKDHWPRWVGGITMDCVRVEGRIQFFRYQYSKSYEDAQKKFELCVASHDPNTIIMLLQSNPYHVDSLLALAEVYKQMGEHQQSANLLEQCLYALECAWHPSFNPTLGTCRLDFSWDANKAFFLALFRHMQHLGRRGCHRTALEVCKLLLSLDPTDPLGALFCIDYFSLRAGQYEWLKHFVDHHEAEKSLLFLPNFSFSVAVACFHLEDQQSDNKGNGGNSNGKGNTIFPVKEMSSGVLLQQALMLHPSALKKIIAKASIKEDHSWAKVLLHSQFSEAVVGGPTLEHLIDIYVERNYLIWRSPDLQGWLKQAATAVTQISDNGLKLKSGAETAYWEAIRSEAFSSDENEYRHLRVSEYSDTPSTLPPEDMPQLNFGPHGGAFGLEDRLREVGIPFEDGVLDENANQGDLPGRNALLVFLQSFMERMDYGLDGSLDDAPTLLEDENNADE